MFFLFSFRVISEIWVEVGQNKKAARGGNPAAFGEIGVNWLVQNPTGLPGATLIDVLYDRGRPHGNGVIDHIRGIGKRHGCRRGAHKRGGKRGTHIDAYETTF